MENDNKLGPPPEWTDDQTMAVLFSPFRESRNVNPNSWDRKLNFWSESILRKCQFEGTAVISGKQLPRKFERKGKVPFCLGIVVQDMIKKGHISALSDEMFGPQQTWMRWTYGALVKWPVQATFNVFVKKPISWTYSKLFGGSEGSSDMSASRGLVDSTSGLDDRQYVVMEVVKYLAEQIQTTHFATHSNEDSARMVSMATLRQNCTKCCSDDINFQLALSWLCREKRCLVTDMDGSEKMVIFPEANEKVCKPLNESEITIFKLNRSSSELHQQIDSLRQEMESLRIEAKSYLQRGMKMSAKNCLRRKQRLELQQDKKEAAIENIHQLLCTIRQTESDKQVLDAYSSGVSAYKDMTKKYGLTTDAVDDVMLGVQEVLDTQDDLNRSIAMPLSPEDMTSDDLERELEDIMNTVPDLPDIPQVAPHQEMIDALCQMRIAEVDLPDVPSELPDVPTHLPGGPLSAASPIRSQGIPVATRNPQPVPMAMSSPHAVPLSTFTNRSPQGGFMANRSPHGVSMTNRSPQGVSMTNRSPQGVPTTNRSPQGVPTTNTSSQGVPMAAVSPQGFSDISPDDVSIATDAYNRSYPMYASPEMTKPSSQSGHPEKRALFS